MDYDHIGESINLINNFKVKNVVFNCGSYNNLENTLISSLDKKNINYYSCSDEINMNKYSLKIIYIKMKTIIQVLFILIIIIINFYLWEMLL